MSGVLNYTTKVPVTTTLAEMQARLASAGADHIGVGYTDGAPTSLTFMLVGPHGPRDFTIPVDVDQMHRLILDHVKQGRIRATGGGITKTVLQSKEHAARVAWRVMKDWLAAQVTLVEARMLALDEVMLPYLKVSENKTLAQAYREREAALSLTAGETS